MEIEKIEEKIEIPAGTEAKIENGIVIVKGPKGENKKRMIFPKINISVSDNNVVVVCEKSTKREKRMIGTFKSHITNLIKGATEGHIYKLKVCSGHFPMNVSVDKENFVIKNFIGEKKPRKAKLREGTIVKIEGDLIIVESVEKDTAGQMAADIEQLTKRPGFDSRIFQDGIYVIEKDGKQIKIAN